MKLFNEIYKFINKSQKRILNIEKKQVSIHPYSDELQKKLGLLINNIDSVEKNDLKQVTYKKIEIKKENKLLINYRLDFHSIDELNSFKTKYNSLIL